MVSDLLSKLRKFRFFLGEEVWRLFLKSILVGCLWFGVESSFIFVLQGFLRSIGILDNSKTFLPDAYPQSVLGSVIILFLFGLVRTLVILRKEYYAKATQQAFIRHQRERILEYALSNTSNVSSHEIVNVFNEKINQSGVVVSSLSTVTNTAISAFLFLLLGLKLAPIELIIGVSALAVMILPFGYLNKRIKQLGKENSKKSKLLSEIMIVSLRNHFLLKIYNLTDREIQRGKKEAKDFETTYKSFIRASSFKTAFPQFAGMTTLSIICFISLTYLDTPGAKLLSFFYIFMRLSQSLSEASATFSQVRFNLENFRDLFKWHSLCHIMEMNKSENKNKVFNTSFVESFRNKTSIEVEDLHFSYTPESEKLFSGLNLNVQNGEVLLLKGESGTGKSTLLSILLGLISPTKGSVKINGFKVEEIQKEMSSFLGYVGPEPFLVTGTIKQNLLYGHNDPSQVTDAEMWEALKLAQLEDVVRNHTEGLERKLLEVTQLSTGQKQRLSIARALLRKPKMLILDEATANLDGKTEEKFVNVLSEVSKDMTLLIISHKSCFDNLATKTIILEKSHV